MKIFVPMGGMGKRFVKAGYRVPKPMIEVDGAPIIEHIVNNFSIEDDYVFGINETHDTTTPLRDVLKKLVPQSTIVTMPYQIEGPVASVCKMLEHVDDLEPVVVNHCDLSWVWDYDDFKRTVQESGCDGAVVCYKGFHPHLLGTDRYATLDADGLWMKEIREKHSWFEDKQQDWTSSGTYYFAKGSYLKNAIDKIQKRPEWKINGEFYISQLFQIMREEGLRILIYKIPFMLQWGTPKDLENYYYWSNYFRRKQIQESDAVAHDMNVLILMAGAGKRFVQAGYKVPKPFICIEDGTLVKKSTQCLPRGTRYYFITRNELAHEQAERKLLESFRPSKLIRIDQLTEGQASTALLAREYMDLEVPLLIGACDHSILFDPMKFAEMTAADRSIDALVFTFRNNPSVSHNPKAYGWVQVDSSNCARKVSVKVPLGGDPTKQHAIIGSFWFRKGRYFFDNAESMIRSNDRINNEFYIDQCMNYLIRQGLRVYVFEVDYYASWGTPDDLKVYLYWQSFFNQAQFHPYKLKAI